MSQRLDRPIQGSQETMKGPTIDKKKKEMRQRVNILQLVNNIAQTHIHYIMLWNLEKGYRQKFWQNFS